MNQADRKLLLYWHRVDKGLCFKCGASCTLNPRTNRYYTECYKHRLQTAARFKQWREKRKG